MIEKDRGQVLPMFALMLVALVAMMALAIDVSNAYASRRQYRSIADAAALAGAQDLQVAGTRAVGTSQYTAARAHAISSVANQFGVAASCTLTGNRSDCSLAGTPFLFSVVTPIPAGGCATCDVARSVDVTFANPAFQLSFAHVLGFNSWRVATTSVAGLAFNKSYAIVTLRPPTSAAIPGVRDIAINGGTHVIVGTGDVGTNANMVYSGTGSILSLDAGYNMYYYDPANAPLWSTPANPPGTKLTALIADPNYPVPSRSGGPAGAADTTGACATAAATVYANSHYAPSVPVVGSAPDMTKIQCYQPGIYPAEVAVNNGNLAILYPGLYFFDNGLNAQGSVIGGYTPASDGVALVFPESQGTMFKNRTSGGSSSLQQIVALNAGTRFENPSGIEATAARDYAGRLVQTNTSPPKLMTIIVPPDPSCPVAVPLVATCTNARENTNKAIDLSGGSGVYLAGVQYAPSDNMSVAGNTTTGGYVGQVWAWTIIYTGGSNINQQGDQSTGPGTLRLDAACTAPGTPCVP